MNREQIEALWPKLTASERAEVEAILKADAEAIFKPLPGPQTVAFNSEADITGFGGAAGGGKSFLACGLALTKHKRSMILRREATQLTALIDEISQLVGNRDGFNGTERIWRFPNGRQIEFGSVPNLGDERKYQGRPHDLVVFDEASNFLEQQVRFLLGWLRTTDANQRCRAILAFNPPTNAEGRWILNYFGAWLDDKHPKPAQPGELRWYATVKGHEVELEHGGPQEIDGETVTPMSRTFIPSRITDNPHLVATGYMATLQSLPEPLRSQMLYGDFKAGIEDDPFQLIPTAWVDAAMDRWRPMHDMPRHVGAMDSIGADVAAGGRDKEVLSRRHGTWFDDLIVQAGEAQPNGAMTGSRVIAIRRDAAVVHVDVVGPGGPTHGFLSANGIQSVGVNGADSSLARSVQGNLPFFNLRSEIWWRMREALDPANPHPVYLPDDTALRADLTAPKWSYGTNIRVESKIETKKRLGRSPDRGDAVVYANIETMKVDVMRALVGASTDYDRYKEL